MRTRILVAEDDAMLAGVLARLVEDSGMEVVGPVPSVSAALDRIAEDMPDLALLDYRLADGLADMLAYALRVTGVPFIWVTGRFPEELPKGAAAIIEKPFDPRDLKQQLAVLLDARATVWRPGGVPCDLSDLKDEA